MAMDVYAWLGYRLHILEKDANISWPSLAAQFGPSYKQVRQFRADFLLSLSAACAAYPDAKVSLDRAGCPPIALPSPVSKITILPPATRMIASR